MLTFCLEDWGLGPLFPSLGYATGSNVLSAKLSWTLLSMAV